MLEPEPIRVLHVITRMVRGGAQENTLATVAALQDGVWDSALATGPALGPEGSLEAECRAVGARTMQIPSLVRELAPLDDARALRMLVRLMRKERPHLVHTHTSKAGILGRIAARRAGVPAVVHTPHGHVFHSYEGRLKTELFVRVERACAPLADRLVALTESERREHLELGVGRAEQWRVIHSGVDLAPFAAARGERERVRAELGLSPHGFVVGTVGRLVPIKGQTHLVDAFARLDLPGAALLLVGDGPLRSELAEQAAGAGLRVVENGQPAWAARGKGEKTVHFLGLRTDVPRLLSAMDLFALPSLNEGMGRVLVEAMALELPCVASRVSGVPDVVLHGETGLLTPPRDGEALAAALAELAGDREKARAWGVAGAGRAAAFSRERMISGLETLYRELLAEKGVRVSTAGADFALRGVTAAR